MINEEYEAAMDLLLQVMHKDRKFGDEAGRRALVKIFELLGDDPRVHQYRRRMASQHLAVLAVGGEVVVLR